MSLSTINFQMRHSKGIEQVSFCGNSIALLDFKRLVIEKKKIVQALDFDLKVVDANTNKEYIEDDEILPNNITVHVGRVLPMKNKGCVLERINRSTAHLIIKTESIRDDSSSSHSTTEESGEEENETDLADEEMIIEDIDYSSLLVKTRPNGDDSSYSKSSNRSNSMMIQNKRFPIPSYPCPRCKKHGHHVKLCPTNGDPKYDLPQVKGMRNVHLPSAGRMIVKDLSAVDVANKLVVPNPDGTYTVFCALQSGQAQLERDQNTQLNISIDMKDVPSHLKCPLTNTFLREAVAMPCCKRHVNDSTIRQALLKRSMQCPLCDRHNVYPDSLIVMSELRDEVELFIKNKGKSVPNSLSSTTTATTTAVTSNEVQFVTPPPCPTTTSTATTASVATHAANPNPIGIYNIAPNQFGSSSMYYPYPAVEWNTYMNHHHESRAYSSAPRNNAYPYDRSQTYKQDRNRYESQASRYEDRCQSKLSRCDNERHRSSCRSRSRSRSRSAIRSGSRTINKYQRH